MEIKETLGAINSNPDVRDYRAVCIVDSSRFPEEYNLPHTPIKNQGIVGSCVAHTLASIVEYNNLRQEGTDVTISTDFIYGNRLNSNHKGTGMVMRDAIANLAKYGAVPEVLMNGNHEVPEAIDLFEEKLLKLIADAYPNRISSYFRIYDVETAKATLLQESMIAVAIPWYKMYELDENNVIKFAFDSGRRGGHAVYIFGWNKYGWKCGNSWSSYWGDKGTFILPFDTPDLEMWGIVDNIYKNPTQKQLDDLSNMLLLMQDKCSELIDEIVEYEVKIDELNQELSDASIQIKDLTDRVESTTKELNFFQEKTQQLGEYIWELETKLAEKEEVQIEEREQLNNDYQDQTLVDIQKPFQGAFLKKLAKIINYILNLFFKNKTKGE